MTVGGGHLLYHVCEPLCHLRSYESHATIMYLLVRDSYTSGMHNYANMNISHLKVT